jgi:phenylacetate-CoA ligase
MEMGMCRQNDLIRTPGGKRVHPSWFNRQLYGETGIEQYQFVQETPELVVLSVVGDDIEKSALAARLDARLRAEIDPAMSLRVEAVAAIARTASGKHRYVISRCA